MKKIILGILIFNLLISCSTSDEQEESNILIKPPSWIQDEWIYNGSGVGNSDWKFTKTDMIQINFCVASGSDLCSIKIDVNFNEELQGRIDNGEDISTSNYSTDKIYSITFNNPTSSTIYTFKKVSENEMSWTPSWSNDETTFYYTRQ